DGRVHDPRVRVPVLLQVEVRRRRFRVFEHVAGRLEDRHRACARVRVGPLPGVQLPCLESEGAGFLGTGGVVGHEGLFLDVTRRFLGVTRWPRLQPGSVFPAPALRARPRSVCSKTGGLSVSGALPQAGNSRGRTAPRSHGSRPACREREARLRSPSTQTAATPTPSWTPSAASAPKRPPAPAEATPPRTAARGRNTSR